MGNLKIDQRIKERLNFYRDTGIDVKRIGVGGLDARENFVVGGGGNHGAIVATKFRLWEVGSYATFGVASLALVATGVAR